MKRVLAVLVVLLLIIFYFSFIQYKNIGKVELSGYIITNQNVVKTIKEEKPIEVINLTKVKKDENIYIQNGKYYVGEKDRKEVLINYPVIADDDSKILNILDNTKLINDEYEKENSFKNMIVASKNIYNTINYEQVDKEEYYFLQLDDYVYINNLDIEVYTESKVIIPKYSIILFEENKIKYYYKENETLKLKVIEGIGNDIVLKIDNEIKYYDLLKKLNILKDYKTQDDSKKDNEIITPDNEEKEYEKPDVSLNKIETSTYSLTGFLNIKDKNGMIKKNPTIELVYQNETYLKKTFYNSEEIELTGLLPNTEFKIIGTYTYINENGIQLKETFINKTIKTKDMSNLDILEISYNVNEIFSNKAIIHNLKLLNDSKSEVLKGIKTAIIKVNDSNHSLSWNNITKLKKLEEFDYEIIGNLKSNSMYSGEIEILDVANNSLKIKNNKIEFKTSKKQPDLKVSIVDTDITRFKLKIDIINPDDVNIENFRYEIYDMNQVLKNKGEISNNIIECKNLLSNEVYKVKIYGDFDLLDGFGNRIDYLFKEINVSTDPISSLGFIRLDFKEKEITSDKAIFEVSIDKEATDSRLIELLDKFEVYLNNEKKLEFNKEGNLEFSLLKSNTEYEVDIKTIIKQGDIEYKIDTLSNLDKFKTLKKDAEVFIINSFTNSNMIDFDVFVKDLDEAIISNRVILEVRDKVNKLVLMKDIKINGNYERITLEKLDKEMEYTYKFIAEEYNIGYTNLTYEESKVLKEIKFITNEGISGKLELSSLLSQITSKNLFDINNKSKWTKVGSSTIDELIIDKNTFKMSSTNGYAIYKYYLPEYKNQKIKVTFKARYANNSNKKDVYFRYNDLNNTLT